MRLDLGLIRELLLKLEPLSDSHAWRMINPTDSAVQVEGRTPDEIEYHVRMLVEHGLVERPRSGAMVGIMFRKLTWEGHDYLDSVRDPAVWRKTKSPADRVGSWTFEIVKELAKQCIKNELAKHGIGL